MAIVSLSLAAAIGLFMVLAQPNWRYQGEALASVALFGLSASLALGCVWAREVARPRLWHTALMLMGLMLAWAGLVAALAIIWYDPFFGGFGRWSAHVELVGRASVSAYTVSAAIAYSGLFLLLRVKSFAAGIRIVGCLGAAVVAAVVVWAAATEDYDDWQIRVLSAGGILAGTAIVLVPVLAAIFPAMRIARTEAHTGERTIPFTCPACATSQRIVVGRRVPCIACGLGIELRLDAPRCACGYDVAGLTTSACPECGAPVERRNSWALDMPQERVPVAPIADSSSDLPTSSSTRSA
jgi:hypothetical protein